MNRSAATRVAGDALYRGRGGAGKATGLVVEGQEGQRAFMGAAGKVQRGGKIDAAPLI